MTKFEIMQLLIGSCLLLSMARLLFAAGKFARAFEGIERRFDKLDVRISCIEHKIDNISERVARLEGAMWRNGTKDN